ncbi:MAG: LptA/OstA family protein [Leptolyngbya sp.]|nr:LptA/OstA family protein [Leptolyngbya sp.]
MGKIQRRWWWLPVVGLLSLLGSLGPGALWVRAQDTITLRSDVQEANTNTGIITARGNVQIDYPAQGIRATAAQADYYSNERRIILSGNVLVTQQGNTLRAEVVTYLIDEGRFVAAPRPSDQVEAIYQLPASQNPVVAVPSPSPPRTAPTPPATILDIDGESIPAPSSSPSPAGTGPFTP